LWQEKALYDKISFVIDYIRYFKELIMRKYAMIAAGGFWGAILRFLIKSLELPILDYGFPINTFTINLTGSFVLGLFIAVASDLFKLEEAERLGIVSGFLGAFTTFSSLSKEISMYVLAGRMDMAALYISLSVLMGLAAVYIGMKLGSKIVILHQRKE
jgi:CrcB protein